MIGNDTAIEEGPRQFDSINRCECGQTTNDRQKTIVAIGESCQQFDIAIACCYILALVRWWSGDSA
jgi:hypothetical protein